MNVVRHKDIGQNDEVVRFRCLIDAFGKSLTNSVVELVFATIWSRRRKEVGIARVVPCFSPFVLDGLIRHSIVLPVFFHYFLSASERS